MGGSPPKSMFRVTDEARDLAWGLAKFSNARVASAIPSSLPMWINPPSVYDTYLAQEKLYTDLYRKFNGPWLHEVSSHRVELPYAVYVKLPKFSVGIYEVRAGKREGGVGYPWI